MLNEKRINYFLNTEYKNLEKSEYNELTEGYFRKSKDTDEWYKIDKKENSLIVKKWKKEKIIEFWKLIRTHTMKHSEQNGNYNFSFFVFPPFESTLTIKKVNKKDANFWNINEKIIFNEIVDFDNADFLGETNFDKYTFKENSYFNHSIFRENIFFNCSIFEKKVSFYNSNFKNYAFFSEVVFNGLTRFSNMSFSNYVNFNRSEFNDEITFEHLYFKGETYFNDTKFKSTAKFLAVEFCKDKNVIFSDIKESSPLLQFISINFTNNIIFRRVDLKRIVFLQSEITDLKFKNCKWKNKNNRLVTEDEDFIPLKEGKYAECEEIYRQLKKNFENNKDWKLSGEAYASEMEMRKRQLKEDANFKSKKGWNSFLNYLFYLFYDIFSCYTQSFVRPLIILIVSWLIVFPLLYLIFGCYSLQENHSNIYFSDLIFKSLEKMYCGNIYQISTSNTFLILKSEYKSYWWLMAIQKILSSILTVFIVLALRKRFKQ